MSEPSPSRRVDAARNRGRILAAARDAFADPDADASMAEIARRAGVGSATLYRNFASRRELLDALYADEIDAVCAAAANVEGDTAGARLIAWLRRCFAFLQSKHPIAAELRRHSDAGDPVFSGGYARVVAAAEPLLAQAQRSGAVRDELTVEQLLDMLAAVAHVTGEPGYREPMLDVVLAGLAPSGGAQTSRSSSPRAASVRTDSRSA